MDRISERTSECSSGSPRPRSDVLAVQNSKTHSQGSTGSVQDFRSGPPRAALVPSLNLSDTLQYALQGRSPTRRQVMSPSELQSVNPRPWKSSRSNSPAIADEPSTSSGAPAETMTSSWIMEDAPVGDLTQSCGVDNPFMHEIEMMQTNEKRFLMEHAQQMLQFSQQNVVNVYQGMSPQQAQAFEQHCEHQVESRVAAAKSEMHTVFTQQLTQLLQHAHGVCLTERHQFAQEKEMAQSEAAQATLAMKACQDTAEALAKEKSSVAKQATSLQAERARTLALRCDVNRLTAKSEQLDKRLAEQSSDAVEHQERSLQLDQQLQAHKQVELAEQRQAQRYYSEFAQERQEEAVMSQAFVRARSQIEEAEKRLLGYLENESESSDLVPGLRSELHAAQVDQEKLEQRIQEERKGIGRTNDELLVANKMLNQWQARVREEVMKVSNLENHLKDKDVELQNKLSFMSSDNEEHREVLHKRFINEENIIRQRLTDMHQAEQAGLREELQRSKDSVGQAVQQQAKLSTELAEQVKEKEQLMNRLQEWQEEWEAYENESSSVPQQAQAQPPVTQQTQAQSVVPPQGQAQSTVQNQPQQQAPATPQPTTPQRVMTSNAQLDDPWSNWDRLAQEERARMNLSESSKQQPPSQVRALLTAFPEQQPVPTPPPPPDSKRLDRTAVRQPVPESASSSLGLSSGSTPMAAQATAVIRDGVLQRGSPGTGPEGGDHTSPSGLGGGRPPADAPSPGSPQPQPTGSASWDTRDVRKNRRPLPKLHITKGAPAGKVMLEWEEWVNRCTLATSPWCDGASQYWQLQIDWAEDQWRVWSRMTPSQRVNADGFDIGAFGRRVQPSDSALESVMRDELLTAVPHKVSAAVLTSGRVSTGFIILKCMKELLPTEDVARVALMDLVERPTASAAKNYQQLVTSLTEWATQVQITIVAMNGSPDEQRLASAVRRIVEPFRSDTGMMYHIGKLMDTWEIHTRPTLKQILSFAAEVRGVASQLATDQAIKDSKPKEVQAKSVEVSSGVDGPVAESSASSHDVGGGEEEAWPFGVAAAAGKSGKSSGKSTSKSKGKFVAVCSDFASDQGCVLGERCWLRHPNTTGKCFRCGSVFTFSC